MLDYLVLYQSESGNTKKIAATIFAHLPGTSKDLIDIHTDKHIPEAKIYFIGFCVHRGTCSMGNSPDYYHTIEKNVSAWIENDNRYLGAFLCQGKMPQKVRQKYESMRTAENAAQMDMFIHNFDEALTHPDSLDEEHAKVFVNKMLELAEA